jgi:hypothetical protein
VYAQVEDRDSSWRSAKTPAVGVLAPIGLPHKGAISGGHLSIEFIEEAPDAGLRAHRRWL